MRSSRRTLDQTVKRRPWASREMISAVPPYVTHCFSLLHLLELTRADSDLTSLAFLVRAPQLEKLEIASCTSLQVVHIGRIHRLYSMKDLEIDDSFESEFHDHTRLRS